MARFKEKILETCAKLGQALRPASVRTWAPKTLRELDRLQYRDDLIAADELVFRTGFHVALACVSKTPFLKTGFGVLAAINAFATTRRYMASYPQTNSLSQESHAATLLSDDRAYGQAAISRIVCFDRKVSLLCRRFNKKAIPVKELQSIARHVEDLRDDFAMVAAYNHLNTGIDCLKTLSYIHNYRDPAKGWIKQPLIEIPVGRELDPNRVRLLRKIR